MASLSDREKAIRRRLRDDFPHYAPRCLKIATKAGEVVPLNLNAAQQHIHQKAEEQYQKTGRVRAIVLKGRQQGCSTYIEGRFYWKTSHRRGKKAFILTHEQQATDNLFGMAQRYHENCPGLVRPSTGAANAKELLFDALDSGYRVATAGTRAVGRSQTIQYFHGSEVAYWPFAESHASGVMQAIADLPDTEIWLESTANGRGNYFHSQWKNAVSGVSDYIAIFVPWFWQPEYRKQPKEGFVRTAKEEHLARQFGLDDQQLQWRRGKIAELEMGSDFGTVAVSGEDRFMQEYPCTPDEAFDAPVPGAYYADALLDAQREGRITRIPYDPTHPVSTGWDLGMDDETAIWFFQEIARERRVIDYYQANGEEPAHYAAILKAKPYAYHCHYLPHDANSRGVLSKTTYEQQLRTLEVGRIEVVPRSGPFDRITATRAILPTCYFDEQKCAVGLEALRNYRAEYDEDKKTFKKEPRHDWASHPADGFGTYAEGHKPKPKDKGPKDFKLPPGIV